MKRDIFVAVAGKTGKLLDSFTSLGCPVYEADFVDRGYEVTGDRRVELIDLLKKIIFAENINIVHAHQVPSGKLAQIASVQMGVSFAFTVHGTYYNKEFLDLLKYGKKVVSVSPAVSRMLAANGVPSVTIPNGVDPGEFSSYHPLFGKHMRTKLNIPEQTKTVFYAGRISWEKADICSMLMRACAKLVIEERQNVFLLIAGGGSQLKDAARAAEEYNRKAGKTFIRLDGEVLHLRPYYSVSDCVIGTGRIALEAMSCGRPLVAVGTKGALGLVTPALYERAWDSWFGDHGSDRQPSEQWLADQIKRVFSMPFAEKDHDLHEGMKLVRERYKASSGADKMLALYQSLIDGNSGGRLTSM